MKPTSPVSLETMAGLYLAAWQRQHEADFALARVRESIRRHGFTESQVRTAAGILPAEPAKELPHQVSY